MREFLFSLTGRTALTRWPCAGAAHARRATLVA